MPLGILSMVISVYCGPRFVRAHGAVAAPVEGHHGLIAGCAFAKDVLKAFLMGAAREARPLHFRDYVDDMTLLSVGPTGTLAAHAMHRGLSRVKRMLRADNMLVNDEKEQVFAQYQLTRHVWGAIGGVATVDAARDLGVYHVGAGRGHPVMSRAVSSQRQVAARIGMIPGTQKLRARMAAAIFFGKFLYGCEVQHLPRRDFKSLVQLLADAIGGIYQKGPRAIALLHFERGLPPRGRQVQACGRRLGTLPAEQPGAGGDLG